MLSRKIKLCNCNQCVKKEIVEKRIIGEKRGAKRVITGISIDENLEELRKVMKGGMITETKRMQAFRNGKKLIVSKYFYSLKTRCFL